MNTELEEFKKLMVKKARLTSIVLGLATVIAVLFMVYGFTQSIEANKQRDLAQEGITTLKAQLAQCQSEKNK